jgi:hypothetical protein
MMNTERIIISQGTNTYAADLCSQYAGGGYGDWYLPSKTELSLMYTNLHQVGLGGFAADFYWSSTENGGFLAHGYDFGNSTPDIGTKTVPYSVRSIRAF